MIPPEESTQSIICFNASVFHLISRPVKYQGINTHTYNILILFMQIICESMGKCLMTHSIWNEQLVQNTEDAENHVGPGQEILRSP